MTALLSHDKADKLAKICGLFGSANECERASAAAQADKLMRASGLSWFDVIHKPERIPTTTLGKIRFAMAHLDLLSFWERGFLLSIRHKSHRLSEKQSPLLDEIVTKLKAYSEAA